MTDYTKLDDLIFKAIKGGRDPWRDTPAMEEAESLSSAALKDKKTRKPAFRFIDSRLQALRKAGRIEFKRGGGFSGGWALAAPKGN